MNTAMMVLIAVILVPAFISFSIILALVLLSLKKLPSMYKFSFKLLNDCAKNILLDIFGCRQNFIIIISPIVNIMILILLIFDITYFYKLTKRYIISKG